MNYSEWRYFKNKVTHWWFSQAVHDDISYTIWDTCHNITVTSQEWHPSSSVTWPFMQPLVEANNKKTSKLCITGPWCRESNIHGWIPSHRASDMESISKLWGHLVLSPVTQNGMWGSYCSFILACEISIVMSPWIIVFEILFMMQGHHQLYIH